MTVVSNIFEKIKSYIDWTAPDMTVNLNYINLVSILQADYFSMKNEIRELKQKNADLRFKNAELCEKLFKRTSK